MLGASAAPRPERPALNDCPLGRYDVTVTITALVPDREIAWTRRPDLTPGGPQAYNACEACDGPASGRAAVCCLRR